MMDTFTIDTVRQNKTCYVYGPTHTGKTQTVLDTLDKHNIDYSHVPIQFLKKEEDILKYLKHQNMMKFLHYHADNKFNMTLEDLKTKVLIIDNIEHIQTQDKKVLTILTKLLKNKQQMQKMRFAKFIFIGVDNDSKHVKELQAVCDLVLCSVDRDKYDEMTCLSEFTEDKNIEDVVNTLVYNSDDFMETIYNIVNNEKTTTITFCYHENIIHNINNDTDFYQQFLENFCHGDFYYRVSFQKQLWQFNDMSFYMKVFQNMNMHRDFLAKRHNAMRQTPHKYIFTKILTKYSNEYGNMEFINNNICNRFGCSREDLYQVFIEENVNSAHLRMIDEGVTPTERKRIVKLLTM